MLDDALVSGQRRALDGGARGAAVLSVGASLPRRSVTNDEVAARIGKTDEWIYTRTGIRERRHAEPDERLTDVAAAASREALERAGVAAAELDLVVVGTLTADERMPNAAAALAQELGAARAGTIEVNAACTGFLTALSIGAAQVEAGRAARVLVVGADFISRITDHDSKQTAMLFADGAGAVVLGPTPAGAGRVGPILLRADASSPEFLYLSREGGSTIEMDGHATFKHAVNRMVEMTQEVVAAAGLTLADVDAFVYHQANARILKSVAERLLLDGARVVDCIELTGNMSAASVPYALAIADAEGRLRDGARVLLAAFGGGFTWGGAIVEWGPANG
ncbi:MAG TPA: beta-ketoacyl-ACP synthase 3 [Conexibacter sp.]|jgi:3-oxoacyl-[acyl-carrier-protein] synthase-3|nr:beta-ketoacyl-ACP synthase 3 [Conexibacter sp.]